MIADVRKRARTCNWLRVQWVETKERCLTKLFSKYGLTVNRMTRYAVGPYISRQYREFAVNTVPILHLIKHFRPRLEYERMLVPAQFSLDTDEDGKAPSHLSIFDLRRSSVLAQKSAGSRAKRESVAHVDGDTTEGDVDNSSSSVEAAAAESEYHAENQIADDGDDGFYSDGEDTHHMHSEPSAPSRPGLQRQSNRHWFKQPPKPHVLTPDHPQWAQAEIDLLAEDDRIGGTRSTYAGGG